MLGLPSGLKNSQLCPGILLAPSELQDKPLPRARMTLIEPATETKQGLGLYDTIC